MDESQVGLGPTHYFYFGLFAIPSTGVNFSHHGAFDIRGDISCFSGINIHEISFPGPLNYLQTNKELEAVLGPIEMDGFPMHLEGPLLGLLHQGAPPLQDLKMVLGVADIEQIDDVAEENLVADPAVDQLFDENPVFPVGGFGKIYLLSRLGGSLEAGEK